MMNTLLDEILSNPVKESLKRKIQYVGKRNAIIEFFFTVIRKEQENVQVYLDGEYSTDGYNRNFGDINEYRAWITDLVEPSEYDKRKRLRQEK